MGKDQPKTRDDGYWIWFMGKKFKSELAKIKGKYLFFHEDVNVLKDVAIEEISNNGFELAKINKEIIGNSTDHVWCLYYRDDSRKRELAEKYQEKNGIKYRYWKSDEDTRRGKYSQEFLDKMKPTPQKRFKVNKIEFKKDERIISIPLCNGVKPLKLSYELSWRTKADEKFLKSSDWKKLRIAILKREDYTCSYCGHKSLMGMQVNHIDGNPKNNDYENLEVICPMCHMMTHSGLWCAVKQTVDCYAKSKFNQNEIIQITRYLREKGCTDDEIIDFLQLKKPVPWMQNLQYLSKLYGFITSRKPKPRVKPHLTEKEQKESLKLPADTNAKATFTSKNDPYESGREHLTYEIRIPISFLHKNDAYGFKYSLLEHGSDEIIIKTWPEGAKSSEPQSWGALIDPENKITSPPVPFLSISTKEIDFGNVAVSESSQRSVTISNRGTAVLLINSITSSGNFAARGIDTPAEIQPNESVSFDVNFSPLSLGSKTGSVSIKTNDLSSKTVVIQTSGKGTEKGVLGGGCLIATATFGSEMAPQVQQLRELRDSKLLQTESGTKFIESFNAFYYSFSPHIADYERENPMFKETVKLAITPMIYSLSILNHVNIDSEFEVLGYGIGLIVLNAGVYFGLPVFAVIGLRKI